MEQQEDTFEYQVEQFADLQILRYRVPGFEKLSLRQKQLIYYLSQAALEGRDILYHQNGKYNLPVRRLLEAVYVAYKGPRDTDEFRAFEVYLKRVWFANGIHHHYSCDKFVPGFTPDYLRSLVESLPADALPLAEGETCTKLCNRLFPVIFDPEVMPKRVNQADGEDLILTSAANYYEGVTQQEAEDFYAAMKTPGETEPVMYGMNSRLVKKDGVVQEEVWKIGGMYGEALQKIVSWLDKAAEVADRQREVIRLLTEFYRTGDLKTFDAYSIVWLKDTDSQMDFVNGFIESYGDPLGIKASWESIVNFKDLEATRRTELISENAQWFEDHSPVAPQFRKEKVKGVSAKVITAAMLGGDCYPATPIGINLPNADWIRKEHGSKSVTIDNITYAYAQAAHGDGFLEEFMLRPEDRERIDKYGKLADDLHTDLHECLGHGSGQLAPGVKGGELKNYTSTLEEARADLFGLYYLGDPKMVELGLIPSLDVAYAEYARYIMNGMMTQLARIEPGKNVEESHMRNRKLIAEWCYEQGKADNVIEWIEQDGKTYVVVNDYTKLRELLGRMLREVQRIKSEGDFEAGKALVEKYAVTVDPKLHAEVLTRYKALDIEPYSGFVNPQDELVEKNGKVVDVKVSYPNDYVKQMLEYSRDYSFLPNLN